MTIEELLELEQAHIAEEEAEEKETLEEKEAPQRKVTVKHLEVLQMTTNSLKCLKTWIPTLKSFH